jgi:predicted GIY-YIG superfamily endonuclease
MTESSSTEKPWFCYFLECSDRNTYIGATVDVDRRLRQHNSEIKGGARRTTSRSAGGILKWQRILYVSGFSSSQEALRFEWRWKYFSRKSAAKTPMERRIEALRHTLKFKQFGPSLIIHVEQQCPADFIFKIQEAAELAEPMNTVSVSSSVSALLTQA